MPSIEVCFSPLLYEKYHSPSCIVVVCDVLRATTSICTAFANGAAEIYPVKSVDDAREFKQKGFIVAAEREGQMLDFADFGNSPFNFTAERVSGERIAYSTTNGTKAIFLGKEAKGVVVGAFTNLNAVAEYLQQQNQNVLVLCAAWKGKFCLEDTLFAGALAELLLANSGFDTACDAAHAAFDLWQVAKPDLLGYIEKAANRSRLRKLGLDNVLEYCFTLNTSKVIPVLEGDKLVPVML